MLNKAGIGYAVAEAVLEYGGNVVISSSSAKKVEDANGSLIHSYPSAKDRLRGHACNMGDESRLEQDIEDLLEFAGDIDHIVYTAGEYIPPTPVEEATLEKIRSAATVRYTAALMLAKHAPKYLRRSHTSSMTFTTGIVTEKPIPGWSVIAGARSAVLGMSKGLALDLKPIRVNVVSVGAVDTETWSSVGAERKEQMFKALSSKTTTGRIAQASDAAEAYVYCMRDSNVTGSVISSNGGALLT